MTLTLMSCFFLLHVRLIIYFPFKPFLLTSLPLCMFCSVVTGNMICIVDSINSLDEHSVFALRANVVIKIA